MGHRGNAQGRLTQALCAALQASVSSGSGRTCPATVAASAPVPTSPDFDHAQQAALAAQPVASPGEARQGPALGGGSVLRAAAPIFVSGVQALPPRPLVVSARRAMRPFHCASSDQLLVAQAPAAGPALVAAPGTASGTGNRPYKEHQDKDAFVTCLTAQTCAWPSPTGMWARPWAISRTCWSGWPKFLGARAPPPHRYQAHLLDAAGEPRRAHPCGWLVRQSGCRSRCGSVRHVAVVYHHSAAPALRPGPDGFADGSLCGTPHAV